MIIVTCYMMVCNELCVRCGIIFTMCCLEYEINRVSYPNFIQGLLFDGMQPLVDRFEVLGTLCCTIREVPRHVGNQKEALLRNP